jgi:hypothetical protein
MTEFQFTIGADTFRFTAKEDNKSIRSALEKEYPNCELELNYCMCMDACSCENGHFIHMTKWVSPNMMTPWIGADVEYRVPLQTICYKNGAEIVCEYSDTASGNRYA